MGKRILAFLAGMLFLAQAASAGQDDGEPGRYLVIPDAAVPAKGGNTSERAILLDTATGRTWVLSPGPEFGGLTGPRWEPLTMKPSEPVEAAAETGGKAKSSGGQKASTAPKPAKVQQDRPFDRYDYDDNP